MGRHFAAHKILKTKVHSPTETTQSGCSSLTEAGFQLALSSAAGQAGLALRMAVRPETLLAALPAALCGTHVSAAESGMRMRGLMMISPMSSSGCDDADVMLSSRRGGLQSGKRVLGIVLVSRVCSCGVMRLNADAARLAANDQSLECRLVPLDPGQTQHSPRRNCRGLPRWTTSNPELVWRLASCAAYRPDEKSAQKPTSSGPRPETQQGPTRPRSSAS